MSLVTGILAWLLCPFVCSLIAVISGHMARSQIRQSGEAGGGLAMAGMVLGYVNLGITAAFLVFWIFLLGGLAGLGAILGTVTPTPSP